MENALAATCIANQLGIDLQLCADALKNYEGIYRRHQVLGKKNGVWLIDDYAHNPAKCAASIAACQYIAPRVIGWFQPHGYGPTRFLRKDFVKEIAAVFGEADKEIPNISTSYDKDPDAIYTSRLFTFNNLPKPVNSSVITSYLNEEEDIEGTVFEIIK